MRYRTLLPLLFLPVLLISACRESRLHDHEEWKATFDKYGVQNACFILRDNNHEAVHYYNKERCLQRFSPASTSKIFNSLVALETALAPDEQYKIAWNGVTFSREVCNKDMTMQEAFRLSCLPYYQELARRIGKPTLQHYLDTMNYGNKTIGGAVDSFWIDNSLQISADEQLGLMKRLYFAELPFSERSQRIVSNMMLRESAPGYKLYYKTGWNSLEGQPADILWVVGYIERIDQVQEMKGSMNKSNIRTYPYFFAMNMEVPNNDTTKDWGAIRITIVKELLADLKALPANTGAVTIH